VLAQKPMVGTYVRNVLEYGTGVLNIDACRIGADGGVTRHTASAGDYRDRWEGNHATGEVTDNGGRWPANVVLTDPIYDGDVSGVVGGGEAHVNAPGNLSHGDAMGYGKGWGDHEPFGYDTGGTASRYYLLPDSEGVVGGGVSRSAYSNDTTALAYAGTPVRSDGVTDFDGSHAGRAFADSGTASRFYLIPKASRKDREPIGGGPVEAHAGVNIVPPLNIKRCANCGSARLGEAGVHICRDGCPGKAIVLEAPKSLPRANTHPTVKPTALMRHLVKLVTPPGGTVLDPFLGSGTTALAAELEGFAWVGIEQEPSYVRIAEARLDGYRAMQKAEWEA
jgi:DNA methylase